jgi:phospholipase C
MRLAFARRIFAASIAIIFAASCCIAVRADSERFRRVFVIVMENHSLDEEIGGPNSDGTALLTPFIAHLAATYGLETSYFGVTHPSLPNYLAMIGGDHFGVQNDRNSCFNPAHRAECNSVDATNLVDQFEQEHISWEGLFESMPSTGFLGAAFPGKGDKLYAQKHNPFVYFQDIALNPARLANLKPFILSQLRTELSDPVSASRFIFIVPNQCSSQHGTDSCNTAALTVAAGDAFLAQTVPAIIGSPSFTERSVLFIVWDESHASDGCCGAGGGGRVPLIAVTKHGKPIRGAVPSNHYSLLATIEDGFGLPRLANAERAATLFDVLPDFDHF